MTVFDTEDEAVSIANQSEYGLLAAVYTPDSERASRTARRLDSGMVLVNNYFRGMLATSFGGTKHSGYGRELVGSRRGMHTTAPRRQAVKDQLTVDSRRSRFG